MGSATSFDTVEPSSRHCRESGEIKIVAAGAARIEWGYQSKQFIAATLRTFKLRIGQVSYRLF